MISSRFAQKSFLLTDGEGGPIHWASALVAGENDWRALLDNLTEPLVIKISPAGTIIRFVGPNELRTHRDHLMTARIVRAKRLG
jgi:hypothetical protein